MQNLWINSNSLYLVNTNIADLEGPLFYPRIRVYPKRKNIAVVYAYNHLFELEKITSFPFRAIIPMKQNTKEYADITTLHKFPYEYLSNLECPTLEGLRSVYRLYQLLEYKDLSPFQIQGVYIGNLKMYRLLTPRYINCVEIESHICLLKNDNNQFITLQDFLEGKNNYISSESIKEQQVFVEQSSLREVPFESISTFVKEKHLQFSRHTI